MARFKVRGRGNCMTRSKSKINHAKNVQKLEIQEEDNNSEIKQEIEPMCLSADQYSSLFGLSDEEGEGFEGFNLDENDLESTKQETVTRKDTSGESVTHGRLPLHDNISHKSSTRKVTPHESVTSKIISCESVTRESNVQKNDSTTQRIIDVIKTEPESPEKEHPNFKSKRELNKINYRRSLDRKFSLTDENNPYKKNYFSFGRRNKGNSLPIQAKGLDNLSSLQPDITKVPKCKTATKSAAKVILNKAHKVKKKKTLENQTQKRAIKLEDDFNEQRPRRTQKSNFNNDYVYTLNSRISKRKFSEIKTPPLPKPKCSVTIKTGENEKSQQNSPSGGEHDQVVSMKRKKARIKCAASPEKVVSIKKKTAKIKNPSPDKKYPVATKNGDLPSQNIDVIVKLKKVTEQVDFQQKEDNLPAASQEQQLDQSATKTNISGEKTEMLLSFPAELQRNTDFSELQSLYDAIKRESDEEDDCKNSQCNSLNNIPSLKIHTETVSMRSIDEVKDNKETTRAISTTTTTTTISSSTMVSKLTNHKDYNRNNYLRLKVIKINGQLQFVDFDLNRLVTFCKECENCLKTQDCGKCNHCRSDCKTTRFLPCWERRCLNPSYGKVIALTKAQIKNKLKRELQPSQAKECNSTVKKSTQFPIVGNTKESPVKQEEVEESFVTDNQFNKASKSSVSEPLQFKVSLQKKKSQAKKDLLSPSGRSTVFTGLSPIKPKLRSTMNELMKIPERTNVNLPRVYYGPETLVKIPWPNDGHEDAAWVSGHHMCFTSNVCFDVRMCFLCGSGGKIKMINCQFCCEVYHSYCLDVAPVDQSKWSCDRCKRCTVCGFKENLLMCDKCHDCYHAECLGPFYQRDTEGVDETWVCGKCVKCVKCGRRTAGKTKNSRWMYNFTMCETCGTNWMRKNYCPVCEVLYEDDDDSLKMMLCSGCDRWIHMECERLTVDEYEILADLPDSVPYICKLCSDNDDKSKSAWYKEIRDEMNSGFLKLYYDLISCRDFKQFKKTLLEQQDGVPSCMDAFEKLFCDIENQQFQSVEEYFTQTMNSLQQIKVTLKNLNSFNMTFGLFPDVDSLFTFFAKSIQTMFPWFHPDKNTTKQLPKHAQVEELKDATDRNVESNNENIKDGTEIESETQKQIHSSHDQNIDNLHPINKEGYTNDHCYAKAREEESGLTVGETIEMVDTSLSKDNRKCLFCNKFGDGEEFTSGRLLYSGMNEWVHINCALWSAEVYEDDSGRLKQVHEAVKRGSKLKCDKCLLCGASIGCCFMKCSRSYHFVCAMESDVVFQDDKKIYCIDHRSRANASLILTLKELSVPRRVVVDLVRFKSIKRIQSGVDPTSIKLVCGGFKLETLGSLTELSDQKCVLVPIGYRVTKIFWSITNPRRRCKYTCEVKLVKNETESAEMNEAKNLVDSEHNLTYCHDKREWEDLLQKTECKCAANDVLSLESVQRKLYSPCAKCLTSLKYCFSENQNTIPKMKKAEKKVEKSREDHNFFPLDKTQQMKTKSKTQASKSKVKKMRAPMIGCDEKVLNYNTEITHAMSTDRLPKLTRSTPTLLPSTSKTAKSTTLAVTTIPSTPATQQQPQQPQLATSIFKQGYTSIEQYKLYRNLLSNPDSRMLQNNNNKCNQSQQFLSNKRPTISIITKRQSESGPKVKGVKRKRNSSSKASLLKKMTNTNSSFVNKPVLIFPKPANKSMIFSTNHLLPITDDNKPLLCTDGQHQTIINKQNTAVIAQGASHHLPSRTLQFMRDFERKKIEKSSCIKESIFLDACKLFNMPSLARRSGTTDISSKATSLQVSCNTDGRLDNFINNDKLCVSTDSAVSCFNQPLTTVSSNQTILTTQVVSGQTHHTQTIPQHYSTTKMHPSCQSEKAMVETFTKPGASFSVAHSLITTPTSPTKPKSLPSGIQFLNTASGYHVLPSTYHMVNVPSVKFSVNQPRFHNQHSTVTPVVVFTTTGMTNPTHTALLKGSQNTTARHVYKTQQIINPKNIVQSKQPILQLYPGNIKTSASMSSVIDMGINRKMLFVQSLPGSSGCSPIKYSPTSSQSSITNRNEITEQVKMTKILEDVSINHNTTKCLENLLERLSVRNDVAFANRSAQTTFKNEMLLRQLKEYLKKHPDIVNYVKNAHSHAGIVPVVDLTDPGTNSQNHIYYSAFLPEHLWTELIDSGIAQKDYNKFLSSHQCSSQSSVISEPLNLIAAPPLSSLTNATTVSLVSSIKQLQDSRLKHLQESSQNYFPITSPPHSIGTTANSSNISTHTTQFQKKANSLITPINSTILNTSPRKRMLQETISPSKKHFLDGETQRSMFAASPLTNSSTVLPKNSPDFSPYKRKKRIKMATSSCDEDDSMPQQRYNQKDSTLKTIAPKASHVKPTNKQQQSVGVVMDTEIDACTFDMNVDGDGFIDKSFEKRLETSDSPTNHSFNSETVKQRSHKKQRRDYAAMLDTFLKEKEQKEENKADKKTTLNFIISNEDGWKEEGSSLQDIWQKLIGALNKSRLEQHASLLLPTDVNDAYDFFGLSKEFIAYLVEQLPGGFKCRKYKFQHHLPCVVEDDRDLPENASGCARTEIIKQTAERDMFAWLSSAYRNLPQQTDDPEDELDRGQDLPTAMKYRFLKNTAKDHVGVYRSKIQGRGLFCKKTIETGDMIIEYSGEKIRSVLTDKREDYYEKKGYGCYMFRIDHMDVVDATMRGNAARFINHSCDPNCYSKVISVDGCKKIIIFAHRRINTGEELTYDYKFAQEDDKLPCYCGSKKCRKYLN